MNTPPPPPPPRTPTIVPLSDDVTTYRRSSLSAGCSSSRRSGTSCPDTAPTLSPTPRYCCRHHYHHHHQQADANADAKLDTARFAVAVLDGVAQLTHSLHRQLREAHHEACRDALRSGLLSSGLADTGGTGARRSVHVIRTGAKLGTQKDFDEVVKSRGVVTVCRLVSGKPVLTSLPRSGRLRAKLPSAPSVQVMMAPINSYLDPLTILPTGTN